MSLLSEWSDSKKCSICKYNDIGKYGNNAQPINNGLCCDWCNNEFVIPKRIREMNENSNN